MMDILERIKKECEMREGCAGCPLTIDGLQCHINSFDPFCWDIKAIRKVLGDEPKAEIIVPEKWESLNDEYHNIREVVSGIMAKQNKIIDCLEQIKERLE